MLVSMTEPQANSRPHYGQNLRAPVSWDGNQALWGIGRHAEGAHRPNAEVLTMADPLRMPNRWQAEHPARCLSFVHLTTQEERMVGESRRLVVVGVLQQA